MKIEEIQAVLNQRTPYEICRCGHGEDFHDFHSEYPGHAPCERCNCQKHRWDRNMHLVTTHPNQGLLF